MPQSIVQVDAFTATPFGGNPAAVCVMAEARGEHWMQSVAQEMNLSATAFAHPEDSGYRLRWFTPTVEIPLCGHATLATAHVLYETGSVATEKQVHFETQSGLLTAGNEGGWIKLDFPASSPADADVPLHFDQALGTEKVGYIGKSSLDYIVELDSEEEVRGLKPNMGLLELVPARGVIVTAKSDGEYDFVSRFFAPAVGLPEDPVCGSAHCCLAPYWSAKLGKHELVGYQASARGGVVKIAVKGDRVMVYGQAVTVLRGELNV